MGTEEKPITPVTEGSRLFRSEALAADRWTLVGETNLHIPISHRVYALLALCVSAGVVLLLIFGTYTTHQRVNGTIVPAGGLITLTAPISGYVKKIYVHVGEPIQKHTPLVALVNQLYVPKVGEEQRILLYSMQKQQGLLNNKLLSIHSLEQQKRILLQAEVSSKTRTLQNLHQEIVTQTKAVGAARRVLREYQSVQRHGLVSDPVLLQQQLTVDQASNTLEALKSQQAEARQQLESLYQSAKVDTITTRAQIDAVRQQQHELQQNILKLQGNSTAILRANHAGVVSSLMLNPGEEISAGSPILALMGKNGAVDAQLLVPSTVIPYLPRGTRVRIRYHAFRYQQFGLFHGRVQGTSQSALTPTEILAMTAQRVRKSMYLVQVSLQRHVIQLPHRQFVLRPGMKLDAIVVMRTLRLYQWLFTPFVGLARQVHLSR